MYLQHFGFKELPFTITPDTSFFMNRAGYQDALNVVLVALRSGEGFIKITGEVGVGKTLLCRKLMKSINSSNYITIYIYNPYLDPEALLFSIADKLGIQYDDTTSKHTLQKKITGALIQHYKGGKRVVLCLDECQAMPIKTLEIIRLLTNLETEKSKLIQVILFGQPELDEVLEHPAIRQLKQRITFSYHLLPLSKVAMEKYIQHRLIIAGSKEQKIFPRDVLGLLYRTSGGVPRVINILCHKALLVAYGEGSSQVKVKHVRSAIEDTVEAKAEKKNGFLFWLPMLLRR